LRRGTAVGTAVVFGGAVVTFAVVLVGTVVAAAVVVFGRAVVVFVGRAVVVVVVGLEVVVDVTGTPDDESKLHTISMTLQTSSTPHWADRVMYKQPDVAGCPEAKFV
jgi:hypothetical protein